MGDAREMGHDREDGPGGDATDREEWPEGGAIDI